MEEIKMTDHIWYVGVNDRRKELFENNWPLPYGVSYNSYLINDKKTALIDTIEFGSDGDYIDKIQRILCGKPLDYLIVNHMEPDHSSMIRSILAVYPNVKLVGNNQTYKLLQCFYKISDENFMQVKEGDTIPLGATSLRFYLTPWVHWPETMMTYETASQTLFTCDAFGGFGTLDGGIYDTHNLFDEYYLSEMRRYYSNIVGKYSGMVQKAVTKLSGVPVQRIAPSHGVIWNNPAKVIGLYDQWSKYQAEKGVVIAFASMYGHTEQMADYIGGLIGQEGIPVRTFDVSKTHVSYLLSEIWRYKGLILGSCAYNTQMHPMMEHLCNEIKLSQPKNKILSIFGSSGWNGAGVKCLKKFTEENGMEVIEPIVEVTGAATPEKIEENAKKMVANFLTALNK